MAIESLAFLTPGNYVDDDPAAGLEDTPEMYKKFRDKKDGVIKMVLRPGGTL